MSALERLADRLRELAREEAREVAPQVVKFRVVASDPLVVEELGGSRRLEEGDDDVAIGRKLADDRPAKGEIVYGHRDHAGDWIISGEVRE